MSWYEFDQRSVLWISKRRTRIASFACAVFTASGRLVSWLVFMGILAGVAPGGALIRAALPVLSTWGLSSGFKMIFKRLRPWQVLGRTAVLEQQNSDDSFPSTHAATVTAFSLTLLFQGSALAPVFAVWAIAVIFSRFYRGAHFPTDLLGGVALGSVVAVVYKFL